VRENKAEVHRGLFLNVKSGIINESSNPVAGGLSSEMDRGSSFKRLLCHVAESEPVSRTIGSLWTGAYRSARRLTAALGRHFGTATNKK